MDVLLCARNNAAIYGVLEKITFIHGDCFDVLSDFASTTASTSADSDSISAPLIPPSPSLSAQISPSAVPKITPQKFMNGSFSASTPIPLSKSTSLRLPRTLSPFNTIIFASPPWGGPGYSTDKIFDLSTMQPYSLSDIERICERFDRALFLPRTADLRQIARLVGGGMGGKEKVDVVQYCMEGASKALVAYLPGRG